MDQRLLFGVSPSPPLYARGTLADGPLSLRKDKGEWRGARNQYLAVELERDLRGTRQTLTLTEDALQKGTECVY
jgi:hypothetical protein